MKIKWLPTDFRECQSYRQISYFFPESNKEGYHKNQILKVSNYDNTKEREGA